MEANHLTPENPLGTNWQAPERPEAWVSVTDASGGLAPVENFKSVRIRSLLAVRWLYFGIALALAVMVLDIWEVSLLGDPSADLATLDSVDNWNAAVSLAELIGYFIGAAIFLTWFYRAYSNLPSLLARDPRYRKGWAIGSWFVPILNLFRPKQIANDTWRAGDPDAPLGPSAWQGRKVSPLLHWWWALWLLGGFVANAAFRLNGDAVTLDEYETAYTVDAVAQGLYVAGAVLAIIVVKRVTARQEQRAADLKAALAEVMAPAPPPPAAPPPAPLAGQPGA